MKLSCLRAVNAVEAGDLGLNSPVEPGVIRRFKCDPMVSVEVERTFSTFKSVLTENCESVTPENIGAILVTKCNMAVNGR